MNKKVVYVLQIMMLMVIGYVASDIYVPALPAIMEDLTTTEAMVQLTLFSFMISFAIAPLFAGPISDRVGRVPVIMTGLGFTMVANLVCSLATSIEMLLIGRFLQGAGTAAVVTPARAIVADIFDSKERAFFISILTMVVPLFIALAPAVGGYLQDSLGWQSIFWALTGYTLFALAMFLPMGETIVNKTTTPLSKTFAIYPSILRNKHYMALISIMALQTFALMAFFTASPFLLQEILGLSASETGRLYSLSGAMIFIGSLINISLVKKVALIKIVQFSSLCVTLAGIIMGVTYALWGMSTWQLMFPALVAFLFIPLASANSVAYAFSKIESNFGAATAVSTTWQFTGATAATLLFSAISDSTPIPLICSFVGCGVLMFACVRFVISNERT